MCYLMTTFRCPSDVLITSWLFTAWCSIFNTIRLHAVSVGKQSERTSNFGLFGFWKPNPNRFSFFRRPLWSIGQRSKLSTSWTRNSVLIRREDSCSESLRCDSNESISSMKMTAGWCTRATANNARTIFSPSPTCTARKQRRNVFTETFASHTEWRRKKWTTTVTHKLLFNNGFICIEGRWQRYDLEAIKN